MRTLRGRVREWWRNLHLDQQPLSIWPYRRNVSTAHSLNISRDIRSSIVIRLRSLKPLRQVFVSDTRELILRLRTKRPQRPPQRLLALLATEILRLDAIQ